MKLTVANVLKHRAFTHEFPPGITIVSGINSSGKTNVAIIMAALVTHQGNPLHLSAAERTCYLTRGVQEGSATLRAADAERQWFPLNMSVDIVETATEGPGTRLPLAPPHTVGLIDFIAKRAPKERADVYESLFPPPDPATLLRGKIPDYQLDAVVDEIRRGGWDAALAIYEGKRREAKQVWQETTGVGRYSAKKGANFVPVHWRVELAGESLDTLRATLQNAKDALAMLSTQEAIEQEKITQARAIKYDQIPLKEKELAEAKTTRDGYVKTVAELGQTITGYDRKIRECEATIQRCDALLRASPKYRCPTCDAGLTYTAKTDTITLWQEPAPDEVQQAHAELERAKDFIEQHRTDRYRHQLQHDADHNFLTASVAVVQRIDGELAVLHSQTALADVEARPGANPLDITRAEERRDEAVKDLEAKQMMVEATRAHNNVVELDAVCETLSAQGARWEQTQSVVLHLNDALRKICTVARWDVVQVSSDYTVQYGGWPVALCAENERLKTQLAIQLAFTMIYAPASVVVLDAVDKLQDDAWQGLIDVLGRFETKLRESRPELRILLCGTNIHHKLKEASWPTLNLEAA